MISNSLQYNCDCVDYRGDGWVADVYDTTPKMALYLVAFAVGELQKIPAGGINGYEVINVRLPVHAMPAFIVF